MRKDMTPDQRKIEEEVLGADVSVRSSINVLKVATTRLARLKGSPALVDHEDMNIQDVIDALRRAQATLSHVRRNRLAKRARTARTRLF